MFVQHLRGLPQRTVSTAVTARRIADRLTELGAAQKNLQTPRSAIPHKMVMMVPRLLVDPLLSNEETNISWIEASTQTRIDVSRGVERISQLTFSGDFDRVREAVSATETLLKAFRTNMATVPLPVFDQPFPGCLELYLTHMFEPLHRSAFTLTDTTVEVYCGKEEPGALAHLTQAVKEYLTAVALHTQTYTVPLALSAAFLSYCGARGGKIAEETQTLMFCRETSTGLVCAVFSEIPNRVEAAMELLAGLFRMTTSHRHTAAYPAYAVSHFISHNKEFLRSIVVEQLAYLSFGEPQNGDREMTLVHRDRVTLDAFYTQISGKLEALVTGSKEVEVPRAFLAAVTGEGCDWLHRLREEWSVSCLITFPETGVSIGTIRLVGLEADVNKAEADLDCRLASFLSQQVIIALPNLFRRRLFLERAALLRELQHRHGVSITVDGDYVMNIHSESAAAVATAETAIKTLIEETMACVRSIQIPRILVRAFVGFNGARITNIQDRTGTLIYAHHGDEPTTQHTTDAQTTISVYGESSAQSARAVAMVEYLVNSFTQNMRTISLEPPYVRAMQHLMHLIRAQYTSDIIIQLVNDRSMLLVTGEDPKLTAEAYRTLTSALVRIRETAEHITVPRTLMPRVVGPKGAFIAEVVERTGMCIYIEPQGGPSQVIVVSGHSLERLGAAASLIRERLAAATEHTRLLRLPESAETYRLGTNERLLRRLEHRLGVTIRVSSNGSGTTLVITGPQLDEALVAIGKALAKYTEERLLHALPERLCQYFTRFTELLVEIERDTSTRLTLSTKGLVLTGAEREVVRARLQVALLVTRLTDTSVAFQSAQDATLLEAIWDQYNVTVIETEHRCLIRLSAGVVEITGPEVEPARQAVEAVLARMALLTVVGDLLPFACSVPRYVMYRLQALGALVVRKTTQVFVHAPDGASLTLAVELVLLDLEKRPACYKPVPLSALEVALFTDDMHVQGVVAEVEGTVLALYAPTIALLEAAEAAVRAHLADRAQTFAVLEYPAAYHLAVHTLLQSEGPPGFVVCPRDERERVQTSLQKLIASTRTLPAATSAESLDLNPLFSPSLMVTLPGNPVRLVGLDPEAVDQVCTLVERQILLVVVDTVPSTLPLAVLHWIAPDGESTVEEGFIRLEGLEREAVQERARVLAQRLALLASLVLPVPTRFRELLQTSDPSLAALTSPETFVHFSPPSGARTKMTIYGSTEAVRVATVAVEHHLHRFTARLKSVTVPAWWAPLVPGAGDGQVSDNALTVTIVESTSAATEAAVAEFERLRDTLTRNTTRLPLSPGLGSMFEAFVGTTLAFQSLLRDQRTAVEVGPTLFILTGLSKLEVDVVVLEVLTHLEQLEALHAVVVVPPTLAEAVAGRANVALLKLERFTNTTVLTEADRFVLYNRNPQQLKQACWLVQERLRHISLNGVRVPVASVNLDRCDAVGKLTGVCFRTEADDLHILHPSHSVANEARVMLQ